MARVASSFLLRHAAVRHHIAMIYLYDAICAKLTAHGQWFLPEMEIEKAEIMYRAFRYDIALSWQSHALFVTSSLISHSTYCRIDASQCRQHRALRIISIAII